MTAVAWAIALSVLSAVCYAAAAVAQEHFASATRGLLRWALPLLLTGAGAVLHVVALQFGTVGVVQALGALTLIFALPIAAARTRRRVTGAAWRHSWLTVGGLAGLLTLSTAGPGALSGTSAQWLSLLTGIAVAGIVLAARCSASPSTRSLLLAGAAGVAFGVASVLTKAVMSNIATGLSGSSVVSLGAIAVLATAGQVLSQRSYRDSGLAAPLAMVSVANPAVAGAIGFLLLGDSVRFGAAGAILALGAAVAAARGVVGLAAQSPATPAPATTSTTTHSTLSPAAQSSASTTAPAATNTATQSTLSLAAQSAAGNAAGLATAAEARLAKMLDADHDHRAIRAVAKRQPAGGLLRPAEPVPA